MNLESVNIVEEVRITSTNEVDDCLFSRSFSVTSDGSRAVVGAYGDDSERGSAYVYVRSGTTWTQEAKLIADDGVDGDLFGHSVSISSYGDRLVVGAHGVNSLTGSAYVYVRSGTTWTQEAKIVAADGAANDWFGVSVSITGDGSRVAVGAEGDDSTRGSAYVYVRSGTTWTQEAKIVAADGVGGDQFGLSVSITGDGSRVVVGAWGDDADRGSAYVYMRSGTTWTQEAKIVAADGAVNDWFGWSVSITDDGSRVVVGAWRDDSLTGSAYVYVRSGTTWTQEAKLIADDGATDDHFGYSVSITSDGSRAVVGAYGVDSPKGSAYIFVRTGSTWTQESRSIAR